jgi:hypothetical protein
VADGLGVNELQGTFEISDQPGIVSRGTRSLLWCLGVPNDENVLVLVAMNMALIGLEPSVRSRLRKESITLACSLVGCGPVIHEMLGIRSDVGVQLVLLQLVLDSLCALKFALGHVEMLLRAMGLDTGELLSSTKN